MFFTIVPTSIFNLFISFMNRTRTDNDRPSNQRSGESSSSSSWKSKSRPTDEMRDSPRSGFNQQDNRRRADENSNWRTREKQRLNRFIYF